MGPLRKALGAAAGAGAGPRSAGGTSDRAPTSPPMPDCAPLPLPPHPVHSPQMSLPRWGSLPTHHLPLRTCTRTQTEIQATVFPRQCPSRVGGLVCRPQGCSWDAADSLLCLFTGVLPFLNLLSDDSPPDGMAVFVLFCVFTAPQDRRIPNPLTQPLPRRSPSSMRSAAVALCARPTVSVGSMTARARGPLRRR